MSLATRLGLKVELEFTEGVWTDIAAHALARPLRIRHGRSDWAGQAAPASLQIELDNGSGDFTPGNRDSPYWPNVRRGVPIRVIVTHDAIDYTRFTGEVASWRVTWPEGDVADPATAFDGVCRVEIEAGGVLRNMQRGVSQTPPVWTAGRELFEVDQESRVEVDPDWRFGVLDLSRRAHWSYGDEFDLSATVPITSFLFRLDPDIATVDPTSAVVADLATFLGTSLASSNAEVVASRAASSGGILPPVRIVFSQAPDSVELLGDASGLLGRWVELSIEGTPTDFTVTLTTTDGVAATGTIVDPEFETLRWLRCGPSGDWASASPEVVLHSYTAPGMDTAEMLQAAEGWPLESPEDRTTRILAEGGFDAPIIEGTSGILMGPQQPGTVVDVLRECADVGGMLIEDAETRALRLRTWGSMYNQAAVVLDAAAGEVEVPLEVVLDDQGWVTQVTASNHEDDEVTVTDPDATSYLPDSITANVDGLNQLAAQASWRLHLGTIDEPRSPSLTIDLGKKPELIPTVTDLTEGDVVRIVNLPAQWPAENLELMLQGAAERIETLDWVIEWNATPGSVWTAGTLALDPPTPPSDYDARLDTAGCELVSGIDATATSFDVDTTVEPVWVNSTDHPDEFPLDIEIGGERMTVDAVTVATGTVQTFSSVTRSVNGVAKSHLAGADELVAEPLIVTV